MRWRRLWLRVRLRLWPRRRRVPTVQELLDRRHRMYERERDARLAGYRRTWVAKRVIPASTVVRTMFGGRRK